MALEVSPPLDQQNVRKEVERALRRNVGIELPHGAGRKVAGIGKRSQPLALAFFIQLPEAGGRHEQLAANLKARWNAGLIEPGKINRQGYRAHGSNIGRDVFAGRSVAAGDTACQLAVFVDERQRHTIELEFANVVDLPAAAQFVNAVLPGT